MADRMEFPNTMKEFIDSFSFKDSEEVYTNGAELVPVFRVEQGFEHYEREIRAKVIDEFAERLKENSIRGAFEYKPDKEKPWHKVRSFCRVVGTRKIDEIAEQMKGGAV